MSIEPSGQACGARVYGVDLSRELSAADTETIRRAWMQQQVLVFPGQSLSDADLERLVLCFGRFGDEPYFVPLPGSEHVVAVSRRADETAPVFAEAWHSDWSFLPQPPLGTCLYSRIIPPVGGDTGFINQQQALAAMPTSLRERLQDRVALHSAAAGYAPDGLYGEQDQQSDRSMQILCSEAAREVQPHPFFLRHPENGRDTILGCLGYIVGIEGMADDEALDLLLELYAWQTREEFQYTHQWEEGMLVMWDNRSVLHRANAGYDGHERLLHRITVGADPDKFLSPD